MDADEIIVIGAGPAGTSAALALAERGLAVRLLDAGTQAARLPPAGDLLSLRFQDSEQWRWQIGERGEGLSVAAKASPKFRVPGLQPVFERFAEINRLHAAPGFHMAGAIAAGGLSNVWGCGVARFDADELGDLASEQSAMRDSYARVAGRIGLSGESDDALRDYFGLDDWSAPALPLDKLHQALWRKRDRVGPGLRLGRARTAVLSSPRPGRAACDLSGLCLWGCPQRATWSAAFDVEALRNTPGVRVESGVSVEGVRQTPEGSWIIEAAKSGAPVSYRSRRVLLAAGTLASTRLALAALPQAPPSVRLQSNPMAAFLLTFPTLFGSARERAFGLAQLSFVLDRAGNSPAFGNLFSTAGLPVAEFLAHLPLSRRAGLPLLRALLPSTIVGNLFLPGDLSNHRASLNKDGSMGIEGGAASTLPDALEDARKRLAQGFRRSGAWMLPGSFVPAAPGADIHYAATLPIKAQPAAHECRIDGSLAGVTGLYVVDGASLSRLPAKAHTLTIMANADRIARAIPAAD